MSKHGAHPYEGGSYTIDKDGKRTRVAFTAAEAPVPVPAAATEPKEPVVTDKDNKRKERSQ